MNTREDNGGGHKLPFAKRPGAKHKIRKERQWAGVTNTQSRSIKSHHPVRAWRKVVAEAKANLEARVKEEEDEYVRRMTLADETTENLEANNG